MTTRMKRANSNYAVRSVRHNPRSLVQNISPEEAAFMSRKSRRAYAAVTRKKKPQ